MWFIKGHVTHCNLTLLSFGKAGSPDIDHGDKESSTRSPSFSKSVRLGFPDFTPPSDRRDRSWFLATRHIYGSCDWLKNFGVLMRKNVRYQIVHFCFWGYSQQLNFLLLVVKALHPTGEQLIWTQTYIWVRKCTSNVVLIFCKVSLIHWEWISDIVTFYNHTAIYNHSIIFINRRQYKLGWG